METTTTPPVQSAPPPSSEAEDKTVAILAYCTLIGFIVAIILHQQKKTKLGSYHLRQALGFILTSIVGGICIVIVAFILGMILALITKGLGMLIFPLAYFAYFISMLVLWVMGLLSAIQGQMKPMPVVGEHYQKWFGSAFE